MKKKILLYLILIILVTFLILYFVISKNINIESVIETAKQAQASSSIGDSGGGFG